MTRAMFVGGGVGLLGRSGVGDRGVVSWLLSLSSVNNSWTIGVEVEGSRYPYRGLLGFSPPLVPCLQTRLSAACSIGRG